jgi:hypothetical protein
MHMHLRWEDPTVYVLVSAHLRCAVSSQQVESPPGPASASSSKICDMHFSVLWKTLPPPSKRNNSSDMLHSPWTKILGDWSKFKAHAKSWLSVRTTYEGASSNAFRKLSKNLFFNVVELPNITTWWLVLHFYIRYLNDIYIHCSLHRIPFDANSKLNCSWTKTSIAVTQAFEMIKYTADFILLYSST